MNEFNVVKMVRFFIIAFVFMSLVRACSTPMYGGYGYGGGGSFFTGMVLGNMMGSRGGIFGGPSRNVRRGSFRGNRGRGFGGGFGFGK